MIITRPNALPTVQVVGLKRCIVPLRPRRLVDYNIIPPNVEYFNSPFDSDTFVAFSVLFITSYTCSIHGT